MENVIFLQNFVSPIRKGLFAKTDKPEKGRGKADSDRRQLKTYQLVPPDYMINPQILLDSYIEIGVRVSEKYTFILHMIRLLFSIQLMRYLKLVLNGD